ncbi:hypothetical protein Y032_0112g338 [Ancylostoma ceylanicum]|uniref:Uncharacterized protein n=1 Tax=Ancylostoma ceylanicum TaxID=53326 RepID=A0A016TE78_9BILA|nr:hypothetical protein Y032_0112g338 [Ancylostoma ceylanicum]
MGLWYKMGIFVIIMSDNPTVCIKSLGTPQFSHIAEFALFQSVLFLAHSIQRIKNPKTDGTFTSIDPSAVQQATDLPSKEVTMLLECLFANAMRFFVLYCVHALRDQVVMTISKGGAAFFRLKILDSTTVLAPWTMNSEINSPGLHFRFCISDEVAHLPVPQITRLLLGERLFARLQIDSPVFIAQMNEYADLLKFSQSRSRYGNYLYTLRARRLKRFVRISVIITYAVKVLGALFDWVPSTKKQKLVKIFSSCILNWNKRGQLFIGSDYDCDSFEEYYILRRFSEGQGSRHSLPNALLKEIARRFDHFFLTYVIHALREHTTAHKKEDGSIRLLFKEDSPEDTYRTDILASCDPQLPAPAPISYSASLQPVDNAHPITPSCGTATSANTPTVAEPQATSQVEAVEAAARDTVNEDGHTDEEWEQKLYERVKQDPSVPHYFKTTFGILVANNRNLREEKMFLQSHLGLS